MSLVSKIYIAAKAFKSTIQFLLIQFLLFNFCFRLKLYLFKYYLYF